jgi:hypothetical protein
MPYDWPHNHNTPHTDSREPPTDRESAIAIPKSQHNRSSHTAGPEPKSMKRDRSQTPHSHSGTADKRIKLDEKMRESGAQLVRGGRGGNGGSGPRDRSWHQWQDVMRRQGL